ncbi:tetratricopeptide repeat protein [Luteolibacter sp. AS25]|uniref:tetratricopeptide repeat protein n=1 Tax=Luteolibacter sp. AS25 TaxID=3135776 RepID=UPI00398AFF19
MKGYIWMAILALLVAGSWYKFNEAGKEATQLEQKIDELYNEGVPDEEIAELKVELNSKEGPRIFSGILLTFMSAGLAGILFATVILPMLAEKVTHAVYDSGEEVEPDPFHEARVFMAQGEWDLAIQSFRKVAEQDPTSRMPWVEISKIYRVNKEDPQAAAATLQAALEGQEWEVDDATFLMFRLAEVYDEDLQQRDFAAQILSQVSELFPETRHSANARSKLQEWGMA